MSAPEAISGALRSLLENLSLQGERHLGEMHADLRQTSYLLEAAVEKLGKSFIGIHEAMVAQQALLAAQAGSDAATNTVGMQGQQERMAQWQAQGRAHADAAMTALQFEDMTGQLIRRILGHVDSLQSVLGTLGAAAQALDGHDVNGLQASAQPKDPAAAPDPLAAIATVLGALNRVLAAQDASAPAVAKKTVAQTHMDSGDIELF